VRRTVNISASVALEHKPGEHDFISKSLWLNRDTIKAGGATLPCLVRESWNRDPKQWDYNPPPKR